MGNKIVDHVKQFGLLQTLKSGIKKLVGFVYRSQKYIILALPKRDKAIDNHEDVKRFNEDDLQKWKANGDITSKEFTVFKKFLESNTKGYYIERNQKLAAWGFTQTNGTYTYSDYEYLLPNGVHILKNLFVKSEYRGESLGKIINQVRIAEIPLGHLAIVFVIRENRYAIRNLKMYGFEEALLVRHATWFGKWSNRKIKLIRKREVTDMIMLGFSQKQLIN
ncbi:hypothetical protein [Sphingobacterium chuzhouense]|uniref:N-acetyltransferase domain-containing protein n=1 Tax=Sphingobacterium chuzhouense TaxID=1742264 RepID=A0ABR7XXK9_9SPHI|nr:hypothetical protein [Sphingobacterium chuzhouense]MBD1423804.1 hypothetical protein [Sphingobacterium chuzhouense]